MMRKRIYSICFIIIFNLFISLIVLQNYSNAVRITSFSFDVKNNPQLQKNLMGEINGQKITVEAPDDIDISSLVASYTYKGSFIKVNNKDMGNLQQNFKRDIIYTVYGRGSHTDYIVHVVRKADVGKEITEFTLKKKNNKDLQSDVKCIINKDVIKAYLPPDIKDLNLVADFQTTGYKVFVGNSEQISAKSIVDYSKPIKYTVLSKEGEKKEYSIVIETIKTELPILSLRIAEGQKPTTSSDNIKASIEIYDSAEKSTIAYTGQINISIRGNSTAAMPKKGYNILFDKDVELLGLNRAKKYALIANYIDKTMLRHDIGYRIGNLISDKAAFVPKGRYVDLFLNDNYLGGYYLSETTEVMENKVAAFGGFMVEGSPRDGSKKTFLTNKGISFKLLYPKTILQINDTAQYIQNIEDSIYSQRSLAEINIDYKSLVDWYLTYEILKNIDTRYMYSVFMFKEADGKLGFGPVWDFDISSGNTREEEESDPEGLWVAENPWIKELFKKNEFQNMIKARWKEIRPSLDELPAYIYTRKLEISKSAECNYEYWDISDNSIWSNSKRYFNYNDSVEDLVNWIKLRIDWLDSQWIGG